MSPVALEQCRGPLLDGSRTTISMGCSCWSFYPTQLYYPKSRLSGGNEKKKVSLPNKAIWGHSLPKSSHIIPNRTWLFSLLCSVLHLSGDALDFCDESLPHPIKGFNLACFPAPLMFISINCFCSHFLISHWYHRKPWRKQSLMQNNIFQKATSHLQCLGIIRRLSLNGKAADQCVFLLLSKNVCFSPYVRQTSQTHDRVVPCTIWALVHVPCQLLF